MSLLKCGPRSIFSPRNYCIVQNDRLLGDIDWRKTWGPWAHATITIGDASYTASSESLIVGAFYLEANGKRLASAEKPSAFRRLFTVKAGGKTYMLKAASAFSGAFLLTESEEEIGSIVPPHGFFSLAITADLPDDLALEVKAFLVWLVIIIGGDSG
jgi:hypothetical protein